MLLPISQVIGMKVHAADDEVGAVQDVYFEETWTVRYLVVDTGQWLPDRLVLLAPESVIQCDWEGGVVRVNLTKQQVEESPDISTHEPISRHYEVKMRDFYGWPVYWPVGAEETRAAKTLMESEAPESSLRSGADLMGYYIHARDGEIGHVHDFLLDPATWEIRYLIVDTRNWWSGKKVILAPNWIDHFDWAASGVHIAMSREEIKNSPEYDPERPLVRSDETALYEHYRQTPYWH